MRNPVARVIVLLLAFLVVMTGAGILNAKPKKNVFVTVHNLSITSSGGFMATDTSEICVFCHTPHTANNTAPLWNHYSTTARTFLLYSSETLDPAVSGISSNLPSDSISRACLTCHDGITALNTLINPGFTGKNPTMDPSQGGTIGGFYGGLGYSAGVGPWIGTNLRNMHPIGFNYENVADTKIRNIATPKNGGLRFFGPEQNKMECPTCHDPHVYYGFVGLNPQFDGEEQYWPFLRDSNTSSRLCLLCHDK